MSERERESERAARVHTEKGIVKDDEDQGGWKFVHWNERKDEAIYLW